MQLDLGEGKGFIMVFARLYQSRIRNHTDYLGAAFTPLNPRICLDVEAQSSAEPGRPFRGGFMWRLPERMALANLEFEIAIIIKREPAGYGANPVKDVARRWAIDLKNNGEYAPRDPSSPSSSSSTSTVDPSSSVMRSHGTSLNMFPRVLAPGLHFFPFEFLYPTLDADGRPIASMPTQFVTAHLKMTWTLDQKDESGINISGCVEQSIDIRSDYWKYLKPSLPPDYDRYLTARAKFPAGVNVGWTDPPEGVNRCSPLPVDLQNPEVVPDADKHWFLDPLDAKDAHGQERIYANFYWRQPIDSNSLDRSRGEYYLILGEHFVDHSSVSAEILDLLGHNELYYGLILVYTSMAGPGNSSTCNTRNHNGYHLKPTGREVGPGKVEYKLAKLGGQVAHQVASLPPEMYGGTRESYVYVELYAHTKSYDKVWSIRKYPIFVDDSVALYFDDPTRDLESVQTMDPNGSLRVGYNHFPFVEQKNPSETAAPATPFGPDRLVRLMSHSTYSDGSIESGHCFEHQANALTNALLKPSEWSHLQLPSIGPQTTSKTRFGTPFTSYAKTMVRDPFLIKGRDDPRWTPEGAKYDHEQLTKK